MKPRARSVFAYPAGLGVGDESSVVETEIRDLVHSLVLLGANRASIRNFFFYRDGT